MKQVKVAAAALNQTPLDWENNLKNIFTAIEQSKQENVSILCLPELCITGYGCEDAFFYKDIQDMALEILDAIRRTPKKNMLVSVGLPLLYNRSLYNVTALILNNEVIGFFPKQHLCSDGVHYENRWFKAWPAGVTETIHKPQLGIDDINIGDIVFEIGGIRISVEVCEDAWVADRPGISHSKRGVDLILNPSASHFAFGKHEIRKQFVLEGSRAFKCAYVYANLLGNEAGRIIFDGETLIANNGRLVSQGKRLTFDDVVLNSAVIDLDEGVTSQVQNGSFKPELDSKEFITRGFSYPLNPEETPKTSRKNQHAFSFPELMKEEEFGRAVALGLFDYLRKSHSKGFVVSLSGGADSAAVSCLVKLMHDLAIEELGEAEFLSKSGLKSTDMKDILTCVYQASNNSSEQTRVAAADLAKGIGAEYIFTAINKIVDMYVAEFGATFNNLNWQENDIALQNIQARVRNPGVWLIANVKNALLLTTSNRSEAAVGYFSLDGDSCGVLSPIGGIDKNFLLHWLKWLQPIGYSAENPSPFKALLGIVAQKPTAELRPQGSTNQTDEADLMPYDILNFIEGCAIRDKQCPEETLIRIIKQYPAIPRAKLIEYINKFYSLWARNQFKREKIAASFHLDDHNLDPKTWCRFPILSGGFDLSQLVLSKFV